MVAVSNTEKQGSPLEVIVVGAGLCGLAMAIAISIAGHKVTVLESFPRLHEVGAGVQVTPNASRLLKRWSVWETIEPYAAKMRLLRIQRYDGRLLAQRERYDEETNENYQVSLCGLHRIDLQTCLAKRAEELGVHVQFSRRVVGLNDTQTAVILESGETIAGDLIVAADGLKSSLRTAFLGSPRPPLPTGQMAYRIVVPIEDVEEEDLRVWMLEARNNIWIGPGAHAVAYSVRNATLLNIVLLVKDDLPHDVAKASADLDQMRLLFSGWDPILTRFLEKTQKADRWRLHHLQPLEKWSNDKGSFVMAGDSCHPILPYMSQGASSAFEDAAVLGSLMSHVSSTAQLKETVQIYQKLRMHRTRKIHAMTFQQGEDLHLSDGPEQMERDKLLARSFETAQEGAPRWTHPKWQPYIWGYDAYVEAEKAYMQAPF